VIARALRSLARFIASARVATLLIAFVGVWSILASLIPQEVTSGTGVAEWAAAHPLAEPVVQAVGLHHAFTAPVFALCVLLLAVSTALCAWRRTKVAIRRSRTLRSASLSHEQDLAAAHDLEIACDPGLTAPQALSIASETLRRLGIRTTHRDQAIVAVSPAWSAWGSPLFHWALLALIVTMLVGNMARASGLMGLAVGQAKPDQPASYGDRAVFAGPLHDWGSVQRTIRVDAFEVNYKTGGVDRGPTPTVSVLDAEGRVLKSQRVYPNETLKLGSLAIYPADYGLAALVSLVDTSGAETRRSAELLDFSAKAQGGTTPVEPLVVFDETGAARLKVRISVPLDSVRGGLIARLPDTIRARVVVSDLDDRPLLDQELRPGDELPLPVGGALRLLDVTYYARLQLVDDPSIPYLYAVAIVAMIGLGIATLTRQQIVAATVIETPDGRRLAVRMRLWRNVTSSKGEMQTELTQALGGTEKGRTS
jgi:cytochrome c biogenesis protein ResB